MVVGVQAGKVLSEKEQMTLLVRIPLLNGLGVAK